MCVHVCTDIYIYVCVCVCVSPHKICSEVVCVCACLTCLNKVLHYYVLLICFSHSMVCLRSFHVGIVGFTVLSLTIYMLF